MIDPQTPAPQVLVRNEQWFRKRIRDLEGEARGLRVQIQERDESYSQVAAALSAVDPYPAFQYREPRKTALEVIPVLDISDLHIGEVVEACEVEGYNAFNWEIAQAGLFGIVDDFMQWVTIQAEHYKIEQCVLLCKGDYISGDIHDELRVTNEWPLPVQTAKAGWLLGEVFRILAGRFKRVVAYEVGADNHGRLQKKPQAKQKSANSMSFLVQYIANAAASRCSNFYPVVAEGMKLLAPINGHRFLVEHGDSIKGWMGIPLYGIARMAGKESMRRMDATRGFDYYSVAHFHVPCWDQKYLLMNGSLTGTTEFDHACGRHALPCQAAYLVHPAYGVFNFTSFLRTDVKEQLLRERIRPEGQSAHMPTPRVVPSSCNTAVNIEPAANLQPPEKKAQSNRARVHGRDVIMTPVQDSARVVNSAAPTEPSRPPILRRFRALPCFKCTLVFTPAFAGTRYCERCRTITCRECGVVKTFKKFEPNRTVCSLSCAGKAGNKSARRKGAIPS